LEAAAVVEAPKNVISMTEHTAKVEGLRADLSAANTKANDAERANEALRANIRDLREQFDTASRSASTLQTENVELAAKATSLKAQNRSLDGQVVSLTSERNKLAEDLADLTRKADNETIDATVKSAIDAGVAPAQFDGYESDPTAWVSANFASVDAFVKQVDRMKKSIAGDGVNLTATAAGKKPGQSEELATHSELSEDGQKVIAAHRSTGVDFTGVTTEEDAKARLEAAKAAKAS
jgi:DNA repair exonuclease SbcCD ATPase subunit